MPTRQQLDTSINALLTQTNSNDRITSAEHREANKQMLDFVQQEDSALSARITTLENATPGGSTSLDWANITNKPTTFAPAPHVHTISDITGLQAAINAKQATLQSGTNIKTVNGQSLLGAGDLAIIGGYSGSLSVTLQSGDISGGGNTITVPAIGTATVTAIMIGDQPKADGLTQNGTSLTVDSPAFSAGDKITIWFEGVPNGNNDSGGPIDAVPTQNSNNAVSSGGTFNALSNKARKSDATVDIRDFNGYDATGLNDSTSVIQSAINQAVTYGGGIVFLPYIANPYIIAGALQTNVSGQNPNAQIVFPLVQKSDSMVTVILRGEVPPNFSTEGVANAPRNKQGVILKSTIEGSGTLPAVIGTTWYNAGVTGERNFFDCRMENLIVRTETKSGNTHIPGTMSGINMQRGLKLDLKSVKADISSDYTNATVFTSPGSMNETYGIIYPDVNNQAWLNGDEIHVEGYKHGLVCGEHLRVGRAVIFGNINGVIVRDGYHGISFQHLNAEVNRNNIVMEGTGFVTINMYDTEHYPTNNFFQTDLKKVGGNGFVSIFHSTVTISGVGNPALGNSADFVTSGSPNYRIFNGHGENVTYGGGGGNPAPTYIIEDDFNRADSTTSLGNTITPGTGYTVHNGTWGIITNKAYAVSETSSGSVLSERVSIDAGVTDFTYELDVTLGGSEADGGLMFRMQDVSNHLYVEISAGAVTLYTVTSGSYNIVQNVQLGISDNIGTTAIKIVTAGNNVQVYRNAAVVINQTVSTFNTQTRIGFAVVSGPGFGAGVRFDNLKVY